MLGRVVEHMVAVRIEAGEQAGPSRRAQSQRSIGPFKEARVVCQGGNVGRPYQRLLITGQQIDAQLVAEEDQYVGFALVGHTICLSSILVEWAQAATNEAVATA